jgi:hypothetical protein
VTRKTTRRQSENQIVCHIINYDEGLVTHGRAARIFFQISALPAEML